MIEIQNLNCTCGNKNILSDVNLKINRKELICIIGANGAGKSTLAKILTCLLKKSSGKIFIDGLDYDNEKNIFDIHQKIGMVFQNPDNQFVSSIVNEDVAFGPENLNLDRSQIQTRIDSALKITQMDSCKDFLIQMLSGGQKQKVASAGTLAINPQYIIFDESTSMIDDKDDLIEKIIQLNKKHGKSIIFITHDIEEAMKFDRLIVMDKGKIIIDDQTKNILQYENKIVDLGLDIPFAIKMRNKICQYGIDLEKAFEIDELAKLLSDKLKRD